MFRWRPRFVWPYFLEGREGNMTNYDEKLLSRVFDSVSDSLAIYDRSFRILRVNQALIQLFGLPVQQIMGKR